MPAYIISGTLTPDATTANTGELAGTYNGQNYWTWTNDAGTWYLYLTEAAVYAIAGQLPAGKAQPAWQGGAAVAGDYLPNPNATGTATVAEYVPPVTEPALTARKYLVITALQSIQAGQEFRLPWSEIE